MSLAIQSVLAAGLLACAGANQEPRVVQEHHPDGSLASEFEVVSGADGEDVREGSFKSFHPDGSRKATGRYKAGREHGRWREWYADGKRRSNGTYESGSRTGKWEFWRPDGSVDEAWAGEYAPLTDFYREGVPRSRGDARAGLRHGNWTFWWENGALKATGGYSDGRPQGEWRFYHPDGSLDPDWITGLYADGAWYAPLEGLEWRPEEGVDAGSLPRSGLDDRLIDVEREEIRRLVRAVATGPDQERDAALERLASWRLAVIPAALDYLAELDVADDDDQHEGLWIQLEILLPAASSGTFGWRNAVVPGAIAANRRSVVRWWSFWLLMDENPEFREIEFPKQVKTLVHEERLLTETRLVLTDGSRTPVGFGHESKQPYTGRFIALEERASDSDLAAAVADGLAWLAAHQAPDGSWRCHKFTDQCGSIGDDPCDGTGESFNSIGVTGLALMAFMAEGHTTQRGRYRDVVASGLGWLISEQDRLKGLIGQRESITHVYNHAIATMALCEAAAFTEAPTLRWSAKRAIDWITLARNPFGGWRYESPPNGEVDTSVTAWMVQAVKAAELAGLRVDFRNYEGALNLIDQMTDPSTGRVGYDSPGSYSSRVKDVNDHFPHDGGESMTAAGLLCRLLLGQSPSDDVLVAHARLLAAKPPTPEPLIADHYYWYYGSQAMWQMGEADGEPDWWQGWRAALDRVLIYSQRRDGDRRGSWDPIGPWGFSAGRVYSTAMALLSLQSRWRLDRF